MKFPVAPYDTITWIMTIVGVALPLGIAVIVMISKRSLILRIIVTIFLVGIIPVLIYYAPCGFELTKEALIIKQVGKIKKIPYTEIKRVERVLDLGSTIRTGGIGGTFGFTGNYSSSKIGPFKGYITNQSKLVLIETTEGKYVISPAEPEKFIEALRKFIRKNLD